MQKLHLLKVLVLSAAAGLSPVVLGNQQAGGDGAVGGENDLANRVIEEIQITGFKVQKKQLIQNQIRQSVGGVYDPHLASSDIKRIKSLSFFDKVEIRVKPGKRGGVRLIYVVREFQHLKAVAFVGNKAEADNTLLGLVDLKVGDPVEIFLVEEGVSRIEAKYRKLGYFSAAVSYDAKKLKDKGILVYMIREGHLTQISDIHFEGNKAITDKELFNQIKARQKFWFFEPGILSVEILDKDVSLIRKHYLNRGYLDVRVAREITLSDDSAQAAVKFIIHEGEQFVIHSVEVIGVKRFPKEQIRKMMDMELGDIYSDFLKRKSVLAIQKMYGKLGYIYTRVTVEKKYDSKGPLVNLVIRVREGRPYRTGKVTVIGNEKTQSHVIFRHVVGHQPGRLIDRSGKELTQRRLVASRLFKKAEVTYLANEDEGLQDVLIKVTEGKTGAVGFSVAMGSDAGVFGGVTLEQRNFDITDFPESMGELMSGNAFRGAGQYFKLDLQPGSEYSRYGISFRDPYLLGNDFIFGTNLRYNRRLREEWDEIRTLASVSMGRRFGDIWSMNMNLRHEDIKIERVTSRAPDDVLNPGGDTLTDLGMTVSRSTVNDRIFPTGGSLASLGITRTGALGGDFDYTTLRLKYRKYWTVSEDFMGRKTVFKIRGDVSYILEAGEAPFYERFYAGGHQTVRGFAYRGIGPRGMRGGTLTDSPVGDEFMMLAGGEYITPLYKEILQSVFFIDMGTVDSEVSFDRWRISAGTGFRLKIPFLGQAPFALDFAVPLQRYDGDKTQVVSFSIALPF